MTNIRGIAANHAGLMGCIEGAEIKPEIVFVNESLIHPKTTPKSGAFAIDGYNMYRQDRTSKGGGNLVYYRSNLSFSELRRNGDLEYIWFSLVSERKRFLFAFCYRPPSSDGTIFEHLTKDIEDLTARFPAASFVVLGDFNMHKQTWLGGTCVDNEAGNIGQLFAVTHGFDQIVSAPTLYYVHAGEARSSKPDVILTDTATDFQFLEVQAPLGSSDHGLVWLS